MRGAIIVSILVLILSGCCTQKRCAQKYPPAQSSTEKDTTGTLTQETHQDTDSISYISQDSSWIKLYLECNAQGQVLIRQLDSYKQGKNVSLPQVSVKNNLLTAQCKVDSIEVYNRISKHFKKEFQYKDRIVTKEKTIVKKEMNRFQRFCFWGFWILFPLSLLLSLLLLKSRVL